jgi:hypothetical protein
MKIHHILLLLYFIPFGLNGSSACVQEKYHFFVSAEYSYYSSDDIWNTHGEIKPAHDDFTKHMGEGYIEFGVTENDTASLRLGCAKIHETLNGETKGVTDMVLGWKRHLGEWNSNILAFELNGIIPIDSFYAPGLRYGEYGAALSLLASKGFYLCNKFAWYDLRLGYLWYSGFPSDQILANAAINYNPLPKLFFQLEAYVEYGLLNGESRNDRSLFMYNPNYRLLIGKFEVTYCLFNGVSAVGGYDRFLWGRNVGYGGRFYCGLQFQQ